MESFEKHLLPDRKAFAADPFGYSALAWQKWAFAQTVAGYPVEQRKPTTNQDLKSPVLWLSQAHAMAEAARIVLQGEPNLDHMPIFTKGVCDSQYCAVGLMLVGYSLEICFKAIFIIQNGIDAYITEEKKYKHHRLEELSAFIPGLNGKEKAILRALTHFVKWAGRYPDPGSGREDDIEEIFILSEKYEISAGDLFKLAAYVMGHSEKVTSQL